MTSEAAELHGQIAELSGSVDDPRVFIWNARDEDIAIGDDRTTVVFVLGNGEKIRARVDGYGDLDLHADNQLVFLPHVTNHSQVAVRGR